MLECDSFVDQNLCYAILVRSNCLFYLFQYYNILLNNRITDMDNGNLLSSILSELDVFIIGILSGIVITRAGSYIHRRVEKRDKNERKRNAYFRLKAIAKNYLEILEKLEKEYGDIDLNPYMETPDEGGRNIVLTYATLIKELNRFDSELYLFRDEHNEKIIDIQTKQTRLSDLIHKIRDLVKSIDKWIEGYNRRKRELFHRFLNWVFGQ